MYHSRVSKSSCFLAKEGSTTANGIQWNAVSHAAKNGYSHLNRIVRRLRATDVIRTHLSGMERTSATCMCGQSCGKSQHSVPLTKNLAHLVSDVFSFVGRWWLEWISGKPLPLNELVILLRPKHSSQRLPHNLFQIIGDCTHRQ